MSNTRPSFLLKVSEPSVVVPARVAALLEAKTNVGALRVQARGVDPLVAAVLEDLRAAALSWSPVALPETEQDVERKPARVSEWMSSGEVAEELGFTPQGVRKAIKAGRLPAELENNRYRIRRDDFEHFRAAKAG